MTVSESREQRVKSAFKSAIPQLVHAANITLADIWQVVGTEHLYLSWPLVRFSQIVCKCYPNKRTH